MGALHATRWPRTRFRRRLTAAFLLVAALSAGLVATVAFFLAREYRWRNFRQQTGEEARIALALAPRDFDASGFRRLLDEYQSRGSADIVAARSFGAFSSSAALRIEAVPTELRTGLGEELRSVETEVAGEPFLVLGARTVDGIDYWFFFSLRQLKDSLGELARASLLGWVITTSVAGLAGHWVAQRTLRPVRLAAAAAESIADGHRDTRLETADDEFGALAHSFNRMADEVQRQIERLEQAAERERRATADIAHDLRTPLTGMAASASLLAEQVDALPAAAKRPASLLVADVHRLRTLVLELLELSRLDAGMDPVHCEDLDLDRAVRAAASAIGASIPLRADIQVGGAVVLADRRRISRILANVLGNAAVHGGGEVTVRAEPDGPFVVVTFTDRGPGIPPGDLPTIFDRFAKSDRSRSSGGSGLGLAIARAHCEAQGGELTADNAPGGGARFTLRLPCPDPPCKRPASNPVDGEGCDHPEPAPRRRRPDRARVAGS